MDSRVRGNDGGSESRIPSPESRYNPPVPPPDPAQAVRAESFERISAGAVRMGIAIVRTLGEALDRIEEADRSPAQAEQPSLLDRLRRAFR